MMKVEHVVAKQILDPGLHLSSVKNPKEIYANFTLA